MVLDKPEHDAGLLHGELILYLSDVIDVDVFICSICNHAMRVTGEDKLLSIGIGEFMNPVPSEDPYSGPIKRQATPGRQLVQHDQ